MSEYNESLMDGRWKEKAEKIMALRNYTCQWCEANQEFNNGLVSDTLLEIHDPGYDEDKNPWEYPDSHYVCLCTNCHKTLWCLQRAILKNLHTLNEHQLREVFKLVGKLQGRQNFALSAKQFLEEVTSGE